MRQQEIDLDVFPVNGFSEPYAREEKQARTLDATMPGRAGAAQRVESSRRGALITIINIIDFALG
jgi:hypothetical protein